MIMSVEVVNGVGRKLIFLLKLNEKRSCFFFFFFNQMRDAFRDRYGVKA